MSSASGFAVKLHDTIDVRTVSASPYAAKVSWLFQRGIVMQVGEVSDELASELFRQTAADAATLVLVRIEEVK